MILGVVASSIAKNNILGPELLDEPEFNATGEWSTYGTSTISGGVYNASGLSAYGWCTTQSRNGTVISGRLYRIEYEIKTSNGENLAPRIFGTQGTSNSAVGVYTEDIVAGSTDTLVGLLAWDNPTFVGTIEYISCKEVTGKPANELHEADNAASLYGEELDDIGSWFGTNIPNGGTFTSVSTTSDNGDYCLELVTGTTRSQCQANYNFPITDTDTYSVSVRAKRGQGTNQMITGWTNVTGTGTVPITSTSWETYIFNVTATATGDCKIKIFAEQANGATGDSVYIDSVIILKTS